MSNYTSQSGYISVKGQRVQIGLQTTDAAVAPTKQVRTNIVIDPKIDTTEFMPDSSKAPTTQTLTSDTSEGEFSSDAVAYNELQIWLNTTVVAVDSPATSGTNGKLWAYDILPTPQSVSKLTVQTVNKLTAFTRGQQASGIVGKSIKVSVDKSGFKLAGTLIGGKWRDTADQGSPAFTSDNIPDITTYVAGSNDQTISRKDVCIYLYQAKTGDTDPYAQLKKRAYGGRAGQWTASITLTSGDLATAVASSIQTALRAIGCFVTTDVTCAGSGGALGTSPVTVTVTYSSSYTHELMPLLEIENVTNTTAITVTRTTPGNATTDEVQTITIPSASAGTFRIQANAYQTTLLPSLQSFDWEVNDRSEIEEPVRCDGVTYNIEGFGSSVSFKHEASDALIQFLANLRGDSPDGRHLVWMRMEARGAAIAGATASQYRFTIDSALFLKLSGKLLSKDGKILSASLGGVIAIDPIMSGGTAPAMGRIELVNTQATLLA